MSQSPPKWAAYPPQPPLCWEQADNPGRALPGTARPQSEASQEPRAPSQPASEVAGGTAQTSRRAACGGHPSAITYNRLLPPRPKPSPGLPTHSPARTPTLRTASPARVPGRATDSRSGPLVPGGTQPGARSTPPPPDRAPQQTTWSLWAPTFSSAKRANDPSGQICLRTQRRRAGRAAGARGRRQPQPGTRRAV